MVRVEETWNTERLRQELGASSIRSAATLIGRLGLTPVSREPGRDGQNLYDAAEARRVIAERAARRSKIKGQNVGQTSTQHHSTPLHPESAGTPVEQP